MYTNANGLWWYHRWRSIAEAAANIVLNIVLARLWGIYGIITATILTILFIHTIWGGQISFRYYFGSELVWAYYRYHLLYGGVTTAAAAITLLICSKVPSNNMVAVIALRAIICVFVPNLLYVILYHKLPYFSQLKAFILKGKYEHK